MNVEPSKTKRHFNSICTPRAEDLVVGLFTAVSDLLSNKKVIAGDLW